MASQGVSLLGNCDSDVDQYRLQCYEVPIQCYRQ